MSYAGWKHTNVKLHHTWKVLEAKSHIHASCARQPHIAALSYQLEDRQQASKQSDSVFRQAKCDVLTQSQRKFKVQRLIRGVLCIKNTCCATWKEDVTSTRALLVRTKENRRKVYAVRHHDRLLISLLR